MRVVIIGSGNLATHLSLALKGAGVEVAQVYDRTLAHALTLADRLDCEAICTVSDMVVDADELQLVHFQAGTQSQTADTAKTVDCDFDRHDGDLQNVVFFQ